MESVARKEVRSIEAQLEKVKNSLDFFSNEKMVPAVRQAASALQVSLQTGWPEKDLTRLSVKYEISPAVLAEVIVFVREYKTLIKTIVRFMDRSRSYSLPEIEVLFLIRDNLNLSLKHQDDSISLEMIAEFSEVFPECHLDYDLLVNKIEEVHARVRAKHVGGSLRWIIDEATASGCYDLETLLDMDSALFKQ